MIRSRPTPSSDAADWLQEALVHLSEDCWVDDDEIQEWVQEALRLCSASANFSATPAVSTVAAMLEKRVQQLLTPNYAAYLVIVMP